MKCIIVKYINKYNEYVDLSVVKYGLTSSTKDIDLRIAKSIKEKITNIKDIEFIRMALHAFKFVDTGRIKFKDNKSIYTYKITSINGDVKEVDFDIFYNDLF